MTTTITRAEQIHRIRHQETQEVMFPKGVHQLVTFCYAMEGAIDWPPSLIGRLEVLHKGGYIEEVPPVDGINMSGMTGIEKIATCSMIRNRIRREVLNYHETVFMQARYLPTTSEEMFESMVQVAFIAYTTLFFTRRVRRGRNYVGDVTIAAVRPWLCSLPGDYVERIRRKYQIGNLKFIYRDIATIRRWIDNVNHSAFRKIEDHFSDGEVLPRQYNQLRCKI